MKSLRIQFSVLALICAIFVTLALISPVLAKSGGDDVRSEFRGIVTQRPADTLAGYWVIGGQPVQADQATEFDQAEGPLDLGSCAKVKIRSGRVHEIDSEPLHDCK